VNFFSGGRARRGVATVSPKKWGRERVLNNSLDRDFYLFLHETIVDKVRQPCFEISTFRIKLQNDNLIF